MECFRGLNDLVPTSVIIDFVFSYILHTYLPTNLSAFLQSKRKRRLSIHILAVFSVWASMAWSGAASPVRVGILKPLYRCNNFLMAQSRAFHSLKVYM